MSARPSAAQLRELAAVVPESKPGRKGREGGLMCVWAYVDRTRGLTLIRGNKAMKLLLEEAGAYDDARYSVSGRGWVLTDEPAAEVLALAESWRGCIVRVREVGQ